MIYLQERYSCACSDESFVHELRKYYERVCTKLLFSSYLTGCLQVNKNKEYFSTKHVASIGSKVTVDSNRHSLVNSSSFK